MDLREAGETCSKHRVERLMQENGLQALHGYRTRRIQVVKPALLIPNILQRQFIVSRPNEAWATGITYIRTQQGWLYLAVVMDLFSRKIVDWAADPPGTCLGSRHQGCTLPPTSPYVNPFGSGHSI
jgi:putative transposase